MIRLAQLTTLLLGGNLLLLSSHANATVLKLAHNLDNNHVVAVAFQHMAKEVNEQSHGSLKIRIYPNGQMGGPRENLEMLQQGALDMTKAMASELEPFDSIFSIFSLPYLFSSSEQYHKVLYGPVEEELANHIKPKGLYPIGVYVGGSRSFYAKKPIRTPDDLKGLRVRVITTPTTIRMIQLLGGSPAPIPFGEVYTALQQGVVDAAENNIPSYVQTRHMEITPYFSADQHTSIPDYLVISTRSWNKLTAEQQKILKTAIEHSEQYEQKLWTAQVKKSKAQAIKVGVHFIEVDKTAFREKLKPMWLEMEKDPEQARLLKEIQAIQ
ncbi:TRAP transporter substrate-binding protein [Celerinatantimonas yamalensis]|uniref:TRAP transporter substrate-binding protein n=2 Tax=Celerinatantimonas yamalensis TaxID=559956 RepID=A0ABW9G4E9_9GAMM